MVTTLGVHSPKLEFVRALRTKAGRREQGRYAVEGPTMLAEALAAGRVPEELYATDAALDAATCDDPRLAGRIFSVPAKAMARLSDLESPPGLLAVHAIRHEPLDELLAGGRPALLLAGIADPGNAGTLVRSAEIFGIERAIFARESVEPYNPKVVRATMGAIFRVRIATADAHELTRVASARGYRIVAAARDGAALPTYRFPERAIVAIGNERHGVYGWLPSVDEAVAIPQPGRGESLNASVAGGIIFYAFSQQCELKN